MKDVRITLRLEALVTVCADSDVTDRDLDNLRSYLARVLAGKDDGRMCFNGELLHYALGVNLKGAGAALTRAGERPVNLYHGWLPPLPDDGRDSCDDIVVAVLPDRS